MWTTFVTRVWVFSECGAVPQSAHRAHQPWRPRVPGVAYAHALRRDAVVIDMACHPDDENDH
jgi:hypothetical protein